MKINHELKTDPEVFKESWKGNKSYEIRYDDRNFKVNEILLLRETVYSGIEIKKGKPLEYTGRWLLVKINHILKNCYGLPDGWCILNIHIIDIGEHYNASTTSKHNAKTSRDV